MAKLGKGIQVNLSWIPGQDGYVPPNAIKIDDCFYVGRVLHEDEHIPGMVCTRSNICYIPWGGLEHQYTTYEVLCDTHLHNTPKGYEWVKDSEGSVPKNAVVAGVASDGGNLYIIKGMVEGHHSVGKVHDGHDCGYLAYNGKEHAVKDYEVLVWKKKKEN